MDGVAYLVNSTYKQDSAGQYIPEGKSTNEIFVTEESVTRVEFFNAGRNGYKPEIMLVTASINYSGQSEIIYEGVRYSIYRTHKVRESDEIELYLEKKAGVHNGKN